MCQSLSQSVGSIVPVGAFVCKCVCLFIRDLCQRFDSSLAPFIYFCEKINFVHMHCRLRCDSVCVCVVCVQVHLPVRTRVSVSQGNERLADSSGWQTNWQVANWVHKPLCVCVCVESVSIGLCFTV